MSTTAIPTIVGTKYRIINVPSTNGDDNPNIKPGMIVTRIEDRATCEAATAIWKMIGPTLGCKPGEEAAYEAAVASSFHLFTTDDGIEVMMLDCEVEPLDTAV